MKNNITRKINNIKISHLSNAKLRRIFYSFLIALVFWFFIKSEETYFVDQKIPLVARDLPAKKTLKEEVPEHIIVKMRGSGRSLIWLSLFKNFYSDYKAVLDLSSISNEYNFELKKYYKENPTKIVLPKSLDLDFIDIVSPTDLIISLDNELAKKVPIKSQIFISTEAGYVQVGYPVFSPDSIDIKGPQEIVNNISFVKTGKDTLLGLNVSTERELLITNPNKLVYFDPKKVQGYIDIQPITEENVTGIPVQLLNKPDNIEVFVKPNQVSLTVVGGLNAVASIAPEDILVTIDFNNWNIEKQFYSPSIKIPDNISKWENLTPNNLEILVVKSIDSEEPIKEN